MTDTTTLTDLRAEALEQRAEALDELLAARGFVRVRGVVPELYRNTEGDTFDLVAALARVGVTGR